MHSRTALMKWAAGPLLMMHGGELSCIALADLQVASYLGAHLNQGLSDSEVTEVCVASSVYTDYASARCCSSSLGSGSVVECSRQLMGCRLRSVLGGMSSRRRKVGPLGCCLCLCTSRGRARRIYTGPCLSLAWFHWAGSQRGILHSLQPETTFLACICRHTLLEAGCETVR